ncbi:janus kinase and microtubule-interacting protein 1-like isoform X2 [Pollicipes pollicipes]|uniref:janus kinase and microtubule-interacting protein 1-like isoform X2 n=1 Tax=Pollicipes pollicipes TaxID=41117 RepID=UPI00188594D9|nr:janus kinase and microtubule-interacting protein 1-like isoform X2 [Pollicipes pollicipes]
MMESSCERERPAPEREREVVAPGPRQVEQDEPSSLCGEDEGESSLTTCEDEEEEPCSMGTFVDEEDDEESSLTTCGDEDGDESSLTVCDSGGAETRDIETEKTRPADGAVGGSSEDMEEEERVLRELAQSPPLVTVLSGLESLRSESGICSSLESNYQEAPEELEHLETRLQQEKEAEVERLRRDLTRQKQLEIRRAIGAKNEEIQRLRARLQADRERTAGVSPGHREVAGQSQEQEVLRLKSVIHQLETERDELKAEAQLCRIREKQRAAELRRQRQQHERELRRLLDENKREGVRESRDLARLRAVTEQKDKEIAEREKQIYKLECQKCYLGEEIYRLTGIEEGFWSDQTMRSSLTDRERGLVRRASQLGSQVSQLQVRCRNLKLDNNELRTAIDTELDVPLAVRTKAAETKREAQLLKKKNQELLSMTRKLEEKVKKLETGSQEARPAEKPRIRPLRQMPQSRACTPGATAENSGCAGVDQRCAAEDSGCETENCRRTAETRFCTSDNSGCTTKGSVFGSESSEFRSENSGLATENGGRGPSDSEREPEDSDRQTADAHCAENFQRPEPPGVQADAAADTGGAQ